MHNQSDLAAEISEISADLGPWCLLMGQQWDLTPSPSETPQPLWDPTAFTLLGPGKVPGPPFSSASETLLFFLYPPHRRPQRPLPVTGLAGSLSMSYRKGNHSPHVSFPFQQEKHFLSNCQIFGSVINAPISTAAKFPALWLSSNLIRSLKGGCTFWLINLSAVELEGDSHDNVSSAFWWTSADYFTQLQQQQQQHTPLGSQ